MTATKPTICKTCSNTFASNYALAKHRREAHPESIRKWTTPAKAEVDLSPLDQIHRHEQAIGKALLELEAERDRLHARIVEIDNTCAKYKKFQATT